jgi:hypothetical protein
MFTHTYASGSWDPATVFGWGYSMGKEFYDKGVHVALGECAVPYLYTSHTHMRTYIYTHTCAHSYVYTHTCIPPRSGG